MSEVITIEPFDLAKNEDLMLQAHAVHFTGHDSEKKRQSYVRWLLSNPVDGSIYLAAYVDGAFASFLGFMARDILGFGRTFRAALAFGAVTLPQFGGRALYRRLANAGWEEASRRGFDFALGYTTQKYVLDMEVKMGWTNMGAAPVMALPLDPSAILRFVLPQIGKLASVAAPASSLARWRAQRLASSASLDGFSVEVVKAFSPGVDALTMALRESRRLIFAKNRRTLDWLYLSPHNPFSYDIVEAKSAGELIGFSVGRRMDFLGLDGYGIVDLVALPGCEHILKPLAARLVQLAMQAEPKILASLVSRGDPAHSALRSLGFIDSRRNFTLIYRPTSNALPAEISQSGNWSHFWGNNDTV